MEEISETSMDHIMAGIEEVLGHHGDFYLRVFYFFFSFSLFALHFYFFNITSSLSLHLLYMIFIFPPLFQIRLCSVFITNCFVLRVSSFFLSSPLFLPFLSISPPLYFLLNFLITNTKALRKGF